MRIAVTGITGFIGHHVRAVLQESEDEIVLVARDRSRVTAIGTNESVVEGDLYILRNDWYQLLGKPDVLLHLAWGGLANYLSSQHVDIEFPRQYRFLESLVDSGLKKLVVPGTCYEYGQCNGVLLETQSTMPNTPYGIAKDMLRKRLEELQSRHAFDLSWARVFYPYGDGQSEKSLYSQLKAAVLRGDREFLMGSGKQVLDFIPVEAVAKTLCQLATKFSGVGIINIGSGRPQTAIDFVNSQISQHRWSISPKLGSIPDRDYESVAFWANIEKLQKMFSSIRGER